MSEMPEMGEMPETGEMPEMGEIPDMGEIPKIVREATEDYVPTNDTAAERLNDALTVMVYAYVAGQYKQEAERRLQLIKEKEQHDS